MGNADRGAAFLDQSAKQYAGVIDGSKIDWDRYLRPEDKARVLPAESLAEECKQELLLGSAGVQGLQLPWDKTHGRALMRQGTLILWCGWSRHGKTRMLKQVMLHAIKTGEVPLIASMEESVRTVWKDMAKTATCTMEPGPKDIAHFVDFIRGKLWLYDQQGTVAPQKIQALIRYAVSELKVTQVMVDSLMMLAVGREDYEAQARFMSELHTIAMNTGVTIHLVAHFKKRDGKTGEEQPGSLHDILGGHELGSIADSVFIVWRNLEGKNKELPPAILKVEKQRGDIDWMGNIGLNFHEGSRQFIEGDHAMRFWNEPGQPF